MSAYRVAEPRPRRRLPEWPLVAAALAFVLISPATAQAPVASPARPPPAAVGPRLALSLADAVFLGLRDNRAIKSAYVVRAAEKYDLFVAETRFRPVGAIIGSAETTRAGDLR